jgi:hypothetical protein
VTDLDPLIETCGGDGSPRAIDIPVDGVDPYAGAP